MTTTRITSANANTDGNIHYKALLDNDTLGQWDIPPGRTVTVEIESLEPYIPKIRRKVNGKPEPIKRYIISFVGKRKKWIAGPVSLQVIAKIHGKKLGGWIGKKIALYTDESVMFGRERTGGIRVRNTIPDEPPTTDPLDNEVDREAAERIARAKEFEDEAEPAARQPGED